MSVLTLSVITPKKIVMKEEILSVTLPTASGLITILPRHTALFSLLTEGIIHIKGIKGENDLAIGQGYVETDGKHVDILVSRAYGQNEINEELTKNAMDEAKKVLLESKDKKARQEAQTMLRRSVIDSKLLRKRKATKSFSETV